MQLTNHKAEPFWRGVAFTAVGGLGLSLWLRGLGVLGRVRGWGREGQVLWVRRFLTLLDLLHLRSLAAALLFPVCSTVDKTRTMRDYKLLTLILLFLLVLLYIYRAYCVYCNDQTTKIPLRLRAADILLPVCSTVDKTGLWEIRNYYRHSNSTNSTVSLPILLCFWFYCVLLNNSTHWVLGWTAAA